MTKFGPNHPLLRGVALAAIVSGGLLIWLAGLSSGEPNDSGSELSAETTAPEPTDAESGTTSTTLAADAGQSSTETPTQSSVWPDDASQSELDALRDGVHPSIARLSYEDRVDSVASVNAGGRRWVLSELPTDTRNQFVDDGLAGPNHDPFGGEILLVDSESIVRSFPMNEFPPTFLETDGVLIYGGRNGDGGYPDSALVGINALTLISTHIAIRPPESDSVVIYGPLWSEGTERQLSDIINRDYLQALNAMTGTLPDGDSWVVRSDPVAGLCAAIADIDYGCDSDSTFVAAADPGHTPRIIARPVPPEGIDHEQIGVVIYGYMPEGATDVQIRIDGQPLDVETFTNEVLAMWVVPAVVPSDPFTVAFVDESGSLVLEWTAEDEQ